MIDGDSDHTSDKGTPGKLNRNTGASSRTDARAPFDHSDVKSESRPELDCATTGGLLPPHLAPGLYDVFKVPTLKMSSGRDHCEND